MSPKPKARSELKYITPKLAAEWLTKNHPNQRNLKEKVDIPKMISDLKSENFPVTDQAISFDEEGYLVNGQNRLTACVRARMGFWSFVVYDLPSAAFLLLDGGAKRTTDDHFKIAGRQYPAKAGATVRRILNGMRTKWRPVSDVELDEFLQIRRNREAVWLAHRLFSHEWKAGSIRAVIARAAIINGVKKMGWDDLLERFSYVVNHGLMSYAEEAGVLLRNWMMSQHHRYGSHWSGSDLYKMAESALWSFLKRERIKELLPTAEELFEIPGEKQWYKDEVA